MAHLRHPALSATRGCYNVMSLIIVADDLTGACDAAAPFAVRGALCVVTLPWATAVVRGEVTAFSTESRDVDEAEMRRRMMAIPAGPERFVFKKIDSVLRGNVAAEIAAVTEAFDFEECVVTPAFPDMGRTVADGYLVVEGAKPVHCQSRIGLEVRNALTNRDLDAIVEEGLQLTGRVLWAGSAGLAAALARRLYGQPIQAVPQHVEGPVIFCIGSDHPVTQAQQTELAREHPDSSVVSIIRGVTPAEEIRGALHGAGAIFITGGDTASMVLRAIGSESIQLCGEIVTGVPSGRLSGGPFSGCPVITKSGGFGAPDTMIRIVRFFA